MQVLFTLQSVVIVFIGLVDMATPKQNNEAFHQCFIAAFHGDLLKVSEIENGKNCTQAIITGINAGLNHARSCAFARWKSTVIQACPGYYDP